MSGKQHSCIGTVAAIILGVGFTVGKSGAINILTVLLFVIGALVGSLIVDIDSKKSKASQQFTRIVTIIFWVFLIFVIYQKYLSNNALINGAMNFTGIKSLFDKIVILFLIIAKTYIKSGFALMILCVLTTLGKMSPHRQFTHKWFGTSLFCITAYFAFESRLAVGFILGYILHIIADKTTPAGIDFFDFKLPLQNRRGKLDFHF